MKPTRTIAIIGGGVAGLGPAWQLAERGWEVHLFERNRIGSGASSTAAGMLAPVSEATFKEKALLELGQQSLRLYPRLAEELDAVTGIDLDYRRQGTLIVAVDRDDAEALERLHQYHLELGLPAQRLVGQEARKKEPGLSPNIHYALFTPGDHQIDPAAMLEALAAALVEAGGTIHENTPVAGLQIGDGGVEGLRLDDGSTRDVSHVLIAAGAWTPELEGIPKAVLPHLRPVRGQMLIVELGNPPLIEHVIRAPDAYLVPRTDGRLFVGSTMEERGFDERLTAGGLLDILTGAWEAVPGIYDAPVIETRIGFRPVTLANEPVIGTTEIGGLHLSVGHGRNGILLTPATAYGLAQSIDSGQIPSWLEAFQP